MTNQQEVTRAQEALLILDSPVFKEAMQLMRDQIIQQWKDCPIRDREGQMLLLQLAKLSDKIEGILQGYVESGKLAQRKIDINAERNESIPRKWLMKVA